MCNTPSVVYSSDPPEVSVEGTTTPVLEYTARNITCNTTGGNPSDPRNYNYEWTYKPTYGDPNIFIQVPLCKF